MNIGIGLQSGWGLERNVLCPVVHHMDEFFHDQLLDRQYGGEIGAFVVMAYAVFPEERMNRFFADMMHRVYQEQTIYADGAADHLKSSLVFSLAFQPERVAHMGYEEFRDVLCKAILKCLDAPHIELNTRFQYQMFKQDLQDLIRKYLQNAM